jgi:RNA recognition motif-containing protein
VTFGTKEAAEAACEALDGLEVDGCNIKVNITQPKTFYTRPKQHPKRTGRPALRRARALAFAKQ